MHILPHVDFHRSLLLRYPQIIELILTNTYGKVWAVGGSVTKVILNHFDNKEDKEEFDYWNLYSSGHFPFSDLDFIAEEMRSDFKAPPGWSIQRNTFGGIKLSKRSFFGSNSFTVDIWKIRKHEPCTRNKVPYTIENVLMLAPLSVQSIAVDLREGKIMGDSGIDSVCNRIVKVNNLKEARHYCSIYQVSLRDFVSRKAKEYNFTPIFE